MTDLAALKKQLRQSCLEKRNTLSPELRIEQSLLACDHGCQTPWFNSENFDPGTVVAGFHPIRSEIDPRPFMSELARRGAVLCLPVVTDPQTIEFRELVRNANLVDSGFGTVGPDKDAAVLNPSVLLVPLSAYDEHGGRIGYGAGFYDRAIERLHKKGIQPKLVGMAFSVQKVDRVPMDIHDQRLDAILTETGFTTATKLD